MSREHQPYPWGTSRASIDLEGALKGNLSEGSSRGTNRGEWTTVGRVDEHDDIIHLVEVLEPRELLGSL